MEHFYAGLENMIPHFSSENDFIFQKSAHISGLLCLNKREKCSSVFHFLLETYFHGIFFPAERTLLPRHALFFFLTAILEGITAGSRTSSKKGNSLQFLKRYSLNQATSKPLTSPCGSQQLGLGRAMGTAQQPGPGELHWLFVLMISATSEERTLLLIIGVYGHRS